MGYWDDLRASAPVDLSKIKVGDGITVKGTVTRIDPDGLHFMVDGNNSQATYWFYGPDIVVVEPAPFTPGEKAKCNAIDCLVLGVDGDEAWIRDLTTGVRLTVYQKELRRA